MDLTVFKSRGTLPSPDAKAAQHIDFFKCICLFISFLFFSGWRVRVFNNAWMLLEATISISIQVSTLRNYLTIFYFPIFGFFFFNFLDAAWRNEYEWWIYLLHCCTSHNLWHHARPSSSKPFWFIVVSQEKSTKHLRPACLTYYTSQTPLPCQWLFLCTIVLQCRHTPMRITVCVGEEKKRKRKENQIFLAAKGNCRIFANNRGRFLLPILSVKYKYLFQQLWCTPWWPTAAKWNTNLGVTWWCAATVFFFFFF